MRAESKNGGEVVPINSPRLLSRAQAAAYCSLSLQGFSQWVKQGRLPRPILGTARWDRKAIDAALDALSGIETSETVSPLDQWKNKHARSPQRHS